MHKHRPFICTAAVRTVKLTKWSTNRKKHYYSNQKKPNARIAHRKKLCIIAQHIFIHMIFPPDIRICKLNLPWKFLQNMQWIGSNMVYSNQSQTAEKWLQLSFKIYTFLAGKKKKPVECHQTFIRLIAFLSCDSSCRNAIFRNETVCRGEKLSHHK